MHPWGYPKISHLAVISAINTSYYLTSGMLYMQLRGLLRCHTDGAVQPDCFPVQHGILDDVFGQPREFRRLSETFRKRDHLPERRLYFFRQALQHGRPEQTGCDRH